MSHRVHGVCVSALLAAGLLAQEQGSPTFTSNAKLVLVPFNVQRGKYFAADLQPSDFILREDGHPRDFTVFEGPHTQHPLPVELILLFDTTPKDPAKENFTRFAMGLELDPKADYEFLGNWDEAITREILQKNGMDIRIAVYHFAGHQLERLCAASSDPREIVRAFHSLLDPIPQGKGELTLLPGDYVNKPLFGPSKDGWLNESIVGTLNEIAAAPVPARRLLILFTAGFSGTGSKTSDPYSNIVDPALAMSIPIDPIIMGMERQEQHVTGSGRGQGGALATADAPKSSGDSASGKPGGMGGAPWYKGLLPWITKAGEKTGGEAYVPQHLNRETLAGLLGLVRDTTLSQYVVGFSPDAAAKPKKHSLAVALSSKSKGKLVGGEKTGVVY
jgi:VWFA-related protein